MSVSILDERSCFKMLGLSFTSKLDRGSYIVSSTNTALKCIEMLSVFSIGITLVYIHLN